MLTRKAMEQLEMWQEPEHLAANLVSCGGSIPRLAQKLHQPARKVEDWCRVIGLQPAGTVLDSEQKAARRACRPVFLSLMFESIAARCTRIEKMIRMD